MTNPSETEPETTGPTAAEIVARLDRPTKISLLSGSAMFEVVGLPEHGLDPIEITDGPHGLRQQSSDGDHLGLQGSIPSTCFPTAAALGSTWDTELIERVGGALGEEAVEQGVAVILGPGLNIKRHPAGGRSFEYLSEDPYLSGALAAAMVRGIQAHGVGTSIKHFAVNNHESHRLVVDAIVDERTLREIYLTGFEMVVREADPWTVMCSYNLVNGTYASEHHELLEEILREEWGFGGLVMTDWGAANDRVAGVAAGLDLEMPGSNGVYDAELLAAITDGRLDEAAVDRSAERVVSLLQRANRVRVPSDRDAHHELGREAAAAGSVLLTNNGVLPLRSDVGRIAVIGAFAEQPRYQGAGSSQVNPTKVDRLLDLLRAKLASGRSADAGSGAGLDPQTDAEAQTSSATTGYGATAGSNSGSGGKSGANSSFGAEVVYAPGYDPKTGATTPALLTEALAAAEGADVVVFCGGLPAPMESEGFDRTTLDLPAGNVTLIEALASQAAPVVVVLSNGGVVHMPWADRVDAVLECWLGGQAGAGGTVDVLFGDAEPGGRLAESIPEHVAQLPSDRNFPGEPRQVQYREGPYVGYRFHDTAGVPARFPFGHGKSYTTFDWSDVSVEGDGTDLTVSVRVTNTGARPGSDVVQVYVHDRESTLHRPEKELKGFTKVHLNPGESRLVSVALDRRSFAVWDTATHDWLVEAGTFDILVARSSADVVVAITRDIDSDDKVALVVKPTGMVATDAEFEGLLGHAIPAATPSRPFNRNSTLADFEETVVGKALGSIVISVAQRRAKEEFPDPDEATVKMITSAVREGPIRSLVLLSGGDVSFKAIDSIIAMLNRDWKKAAATIRGDGRTN